MGVLCGYHLMYFNEAKSLVGIRIAFSIKMIINLLKLIMELMFANAFFRLLQGLIADSYLKSYNTHRGVISLYLIFSCIRIYLGMMDDVHSTLVMISHWLYNLINNILLQGILAINVRNILYFDL